MAKQPRKNKRESQKDIYRSLVESINSAVNLPVSIWIPNDEQKALFIKASVGLPSAYVGKARLDLSEVSVTGEAFSTGKIIEVSDVLADRRWKYRKDAQEMGWKSVLCVPVKVRGKVIGVTSIYSFVKRSFSEMEKRSISDYAAHLELGFEAERMRHSLDRLLTLGQKVERQIAKRPEAVYQEIVKGFAEVTGADCVVLYPYDSYRENFYNIDHVVASGLLKKLQPTDKPRTKEGMAAYVKREGEVIKSNIEEEDPPLLDSPFIKREGVKAFVGLALRVAGKDLGVLYVDFRKPHEFHSEELKVIHIFAHQAAIAINNANLYRETEERAKALGHLNEVVPQLVSIGDTPRGLKGLLKQIGQKAKTVLNADLVDIYQYFQEQDKCDLPIRVGKQISAPVQKNRIYPDDVVCSIVKDRKSSYFTDAQAESILTQAFSARPKAPKKRFVFRERLKSVAAVPMILGDEIVGVLFINYRRSQTFPPQQRNLIESFASQAAVALHTARLYEGVRSRLREHIKNIEALQRVYALTITDSLDAVLLQIAKQATQLTPAKYAGIWLVDRQNNELYFGAEYGRDLTSKRRQHRLPIDDTSINGHVAVTKETYYCRNVEGDPYYRKWYEDVKSELTTPMKYDTEVIGTFNVESPDVGAFNDDHVEIINALGGAIAVAIKNARLLERLNVLEDIGVKLTSEIHLKENEILESIHNQALRLTGAQDMYIALYDQNSGEISFPLATEKGKRVQYPTRKADLKKRGKTEEIIFTHKPILHRTKKEAEKWYSQPGHAEFIGNLSPSWLGVPMIVGKRVLGVIATVDWGKEHAYDEQDLQVFASMASQAAIALDNANLYYDVNQKLEKTNQKLERRVAALASLNDIGKELTSDIRLREDAILNLIFTKAQELTHSKDLYIALYNDDTGDICFALATEKGRLVTYPARKADMEHRGKTEEIIFTRKPILHRTLREANEWYSQFGHNEYIGKIQPSWLGVPMMIGEKVFGVIAAVDLEKEYAYDELDRDVLLSMASQAAIALENARLYEEARGEIVATKQLATLGIAIAAVQHRINNTLNIINPNITRLRSRIDTTDPTIQEILDIIERNTVYTSKALARIQTPLKEVDSVEVNVNSLLKENFDQLISEWDADSIHPEVKAKLTLDDTIPLIWAPVGQISEIVKNLIDNALRAMKKGGELTVSSELSNSMICIRVKDTAEGGIPPSIQARLFEKPVPSKEQGQGSGLGLWLSRLMLQGIGGNVTIESTCSTGTTMLVQIPAMGTKGATI